MNIKEMKDLIQVVLQSDISEFEIEYTGTKLKLKRGLSSSSVLISHMESKPASASELLPQVQVAQTIVSQRETAADSDDNDLHIIASPIVGTFYRSSSPGTEPYVKLGDQIEEGTILCIVEAMKLVNEIPSDIGGEVARIYIENGRPVEFGQRLFGIRPRKQG